MQKIDKYFVVDFDRCIGNIDASFKILSEVAHELSIVDKQLFMSMRKEAELEGKPFSALKHLKETYPSVDLNKIKNMYLKQSLVKSNNLLEPGAKELIDYFYSTNQDFCIMSFGDKRWQSTKIIGAGITNVPIKIVSNRQKSNYIRKWQDLKSGKFIIPKEYFLDNKAKEVNEVILIDDKVTAFHNLPKGTRGYLVLGSSTKVTKNLLYKLNSQVKQIMRINEIIDEEFSKKKSI